MTDPRIDTGTNHTVESEDLRVHIDGADTHDCCRPARLLSNPEDQVSSGGVGHRRHVCEELALVSVGGPWQVGLEVNGPPLVHLANECLYVSLFDVLEFLRNHGELRQAKTPYPAPSTFTAAVLGSP